MKTYPIMLQVAGRLCVVVGAGKVGRRKANSLARAGAAVRVVDPDAAGAELPDGVQLLRRPYSADALAGALLVFACTDRPALNAQIAADARTAGALVNVADDPEHCDFFAPAVAGSGDVVVAVGTGGSSPALAAELKEKLAAHLPERLGQFAEALRHLRQHVHERTADAGRRRRALRRLATDEGYTAFIRAGEKGLIDLADEVLEAI